MDGLGSRIAHLMGMPVTEVSVDDPQCCFVRGHDRLVYSMRAYDAWTTDAHDLAGLGRAASAQARSLAAGTALGHVGVEGDGPRSRAREQGYDWRAVGENVGAGRRSVRTVMESWVASTGHLTNLVDPAFRNLGVAVAIDEDFAHGIYWVQHFGRGGPGRVRN